MFGPSGPLQTKTKEVGASTPLMLVNLDLNQNSTSSQDPTTQLGLEDLEWGVLQSWWTTNE